MELDLERTLNEALLKLNETIKELIFERSARKQINEEYDKIKESNRILEGRVSELEQTICELNSLKKEE